MATKYYSDGTYTKGDGKLYRPGIGVVGTVGSTTASRNESGTTKGGTTTTTTTTSKPSSSSSSSTKKQNQDRYNAATSGSQSIEDYLKSYGVDPNVRYDSVKDKYKGTANENKYTYVEDKYATQQKSQAQNIDDYLAQYGIQLPQQTAQQMAEERLENPYEQAMEDYKEQQEYIREQQRLANQAAVNSGVERLQNQLKTTGKSFDEAGRQEYIRATQAEYALPNQLAAMGYTGGLSETEAARGRANYQNRMADIEQQRVNAQNEVYAAINELKNTADQRTAEQNIALAQQYADRLLELQVQAQQYETQKQANDMQNWQNNAQYLYANDYTAEIQKLQADNADGKNDSKIAYLMALRQQKLNNMADNEAEQAAAQSKAYQQEYENALALAKIGVFEPLQALGYDVSNLRKQWNADYNKTIASTKTGSGGSGSGTPKANQTYQQVLNAIQDMTPSGGSDYQENVSAAKYLLNSDMSAENILSIMKQVNVRPEAMVREMMSEGYSLEDISAFVDAYTPNQAYRDSIMQYAQK